MSTENTITRVKGEVRRAVYLTDDDWQTVLLALENDELNDRWSRAVKQEVERQLSRSS